jgi:hypothetical protein
MRGARYVHLIPWTLRSGSEQLQCIERLCCHYKAIIRKIGIAIQLKGIYHYVIAAL